MRLLRHPARARTDAAASQSTAPIARALRRLSRRARAERGFTIIEVLAATLILSVGIVALFGMLIGSDHAMAKDKIRQDETSMAREVLEDARGLPYTDLYTSGIASALQPIVSGATASGSTLTVTRGTYTFSVSLTACSLDSPPSGYGYGNHSVAPASGGTWCADVGTTSSTNPNPDPDDVKRVTATISAVGDTQGSPIEQTILVYARPDHGPAVTCLTTSTAGTNCGNSVSVTTAGTKSLSFNVTTTAVASKIQWLVNGTQPPSTEIPTGSTDPYSPSATGSSFTWNMPYVVVGGTNTYFDGTFTITAIAYNSSGEAGTRSAVQVTINEHTVIPPATVNAGWNSTLKVVDVQWASSIDQDVVNYQVMHQVGSGSSTQVCQTSNSSITTCTDTTASAPNNGSSCTYGVDSGTTNQYWVLGYDTNPLTLASRAGSASSKVDANLCDSPPNTPTGLTAATSGSSVVLTWSAPSPADPDSGDSIAYWRIYRWSGSTGQAVSTRYDVISNTGATTYTDTSPDPSSVPQNYCVSAVDTHMNESPCSTQVGPQ